MVARGQGEGEGGEGAGLADSPFDKHRVSVLRDAKHSQGGDSEDNTIIGMYSAPPMWALESLKWPMLRYVYFTMIFKIFITNLG